MTAQAEVCRRRGTFGFHIVPLACCLALALACDTPTPGRPGGTDVGRLDAAAGNGGQGGIATGAGAGGSAGSNSDGGPARGGGAGGGSGGMGAPGATGGAGSPGQGGSGALDGGLAPGGQGGQGGQPGGSAPPPSRLVVLGDSIVACSTLASKTDPACSPHKLYQYLKTTYVSGLVYDNQAVGGAVTADVPARQTDRISSGGGHALVLIYVGGNDLRPYMLASDAAAEAGYQRSLPQVRAAWAQIFAALADRGRFPDGVTVIMNNQYSPWDGCTALPFFISAKKHQLLGAYNQELAALAAAGGALLTDQYTPYLGHGHHYNVRTCPHYMAGTTPFMADLIHPNQAGHDNLFQQWKKVVDRLYRR